MVGAGFVWLVYSMRLCVDDRQTPGVLPENSSKDGHGPSVLMILRLSSDVLIGISRPAISRSTSS